MITYLFLKAFVGIGERIRDIAEQECWGESKIKQELLELQMRLEMEEIAEEEYVVAEAALMQRLQEGRRRRGEGGEE
jgi:hypothetical protein